MQLSSIFIRLFFASVLTAIPDQTWGFNQTPAYQLNWKVGGIPNRLDFGSGVVTDALGYVYVGGETGPLHGTPNVGPLGALVTKYDSAGGLVWQRMAYVNRGLDHVSAMQIDAENNVFITGETYRYPAGAEAYLVKYSADGDVLWERHLGSTANEFGKGLDVDALGNAYVTGVTTGLVGDVDYRSFDAYMAKYSPSGDPLWIKQFPDSVGDRGSAVAIASNGDIYMAGSNEGATQEFLAKLDSNAEVIWRQVINYSSLPSHRTNIYDIASDSSGNVYTAGLTDGIYSGCCGFTDYDAVLAKHDSSGNLLWQRKIKTAFKEVIQDITFDTFGNVYVCGGTEGSISGSNAGKSDGFWAKYDPNGNLLWLQQFGTPQSENGFGISVDSAGRVYVAGTTTQITNTGSDPDAFLAQFAVIPEPSTLLLVATASLCLAFPRRSQNC